MVAITKKLEIFFQIVFKYNIYIREKIASGVESLGQIVKRIKENCRYPVLSIAWCGLGAVLRPRSLDLPDAHTLIS